MENNIKEAIDNYCVKVCNQISKFTNYSYISFWDITDSLLLYHTSKNNLISRFEQGADDILESFIKTYKNDKDNGGFENCIVAYGIHELVRKSFCEGDPDEILTNVDKCVFKEVTNIVEIKNSVPIINFLLYFYIRYLYDGHDTLYKKFKEETIFHLLNCSSRLHSEFLYDLVQDIECSIIDSNYLYLNLLASMIKIDLFSNKVKRILKEYESILVSLIPQLSYNKLLYIITLYRINSTLNSDKISKHIVSIADSLDYKLLINDFKSSDFRKNTGAVSRLLILKYFINYCKLDNGLLGTDLLDCLRENENNFICYINKKINMIEDVNDLLQLKEFSRQGFEMLLLRKMY